jgi:hypothetical protein
MNPVMNFPRTTPAESAAHRLHFILVIFGLALAMSLAGCGNRLAITRGKLTELFSLGYGLADNQLSVSSSGNGILDLTMEGGIFHLLDGTGGKVVKYSSYGDILAMVYDDSKSLQPRSIPGIPVTVQRFGEPAKIAIDSRQTLHVADRQSYSPSGASGQNLPPASGWIVRRFAQGGKELLPLGREGPGGSAFGTILSLWTLEDDTLIVVSVSQDGRVLSRFSRAGQLMTVLDLPDKSLPKTPELLSAIEGKEGYRLHAGLDGITGYAGSRGFELVLKIDYHLERYDPSIGIGTDMEYAGTWIVTLDGSSGRTLSMMRVPSRVEKEGIPELAGVRNGLFYLLTPAKAQSSHAQGVPVSHDGGAWAEGRILEIIDSEGKVRDRYRLELPPDTRMVPVLKLASTGQIFALVIRPAAAEVVWWDFS